MTCWRSEFTGKLRFVKRRALLLQNLALYQNAVQKPKGQLRKLASQGWVETFSLYEITVLTPAIQTQVARIVVILLELSIRTRSILSQNNIGNA